MKKVISLLMAIAVLMTLAVACGKSGGTDTTATTTTAGTQAGVKTTEAPKPVTIEVTSMMVQEDRQNLMNKTIEKLNQKFPHITVKHNAIKSGEPYNQAIKLAFSSGQGLDIVYLDDANQQMLKDYIMDLTDIVLERKWLEKQVPGAIEYNNRRTPGKYYSVPFCMAPMAVYYNKNIFNELGLKPPTNLDELNDILAKVKAAGYIPFEVCGMQPYNLNWIMEGIMYGSVPLEHITKWYYLQETTPEYKKAFKEAAQLIDEWIKKGYFREDVMSLDYKDVTTLFAQGKTAMAVDGDWNLNGYESSNFPVGIFAFPRKDTSLPLTITNSSDNAWALNKDLSPEKKQAAIEFIDIFMDPEVAKMWYEGGFTVSVKIDTSSLNISPLKRELINAVSGAGVGYYTDAAMSGLTDVYIKNYQMLLMQEVTVDEFCKNMEEGYEKLKAENLNK